MPESQHVVGADFVLRTKHYLEATLMIEVPWTVYDNTGLTVLHDFEGNPHSYDLLGKLKEGNKSAIFVEAKYRDKPSEINSEFERFLRISFSCYVACRPSKDPYFMFVTSRPFKSNTFHKLTQPEHLSVLLNGPCHGISNPQLQDIVDFSARLWFVIWSNKQDLMVVSDPTLYAKLGPRGGDRS